MINNPFILLPFISSRDKDETTLTRCTFLEPENTTVDEAAAHTGCLQELLPFNAFSPFT